MPTSRSSPCRTLTLPIKPPPRATTRPSTRRSYPWRFRSVVGPSSDDEELLRRRPDSKTWSALEYTAHVADLLEAMAPQLTEIAQKDNPEIVDPIDPDHRAAERRYNDMDPG